MLLVVAVHVKMWRHQDVLCHFGGLIYRKYTPSRELMIETLAKIHSGQKNKITKWPPSTPATPPIGPPIQSIIDAVTWPALIGWLTFSFSEETHLHWWTPFDSIAALPFRWNLHCRLEVVQIVQPGGKNHSWISNKSAISEIYDWLDEFIINIWQTKWSR